MSALLPWPWTASSSTTTILKRCTRCSRKLRRWQRALERRTVGSRGWHEAQRRVAAVHRRSIGLRENAHHQVSRLLVRKYAVLAIESLNVAGMDQLPHQAKAIRDAAIGGLLQKIRYKADWYGTVVVEADRFYPSSKLCSDCGAHKRRVGSGNHTGPAQTAACDTTATKMPRSIC